MSLSGSFEASVRNTHRELTLPPGSRAACPSKVCGDSNCLQFHSLLESLSSNLGPPRLFSRLEITLSHAPSSTLLARDAQPESFFRPGRKTALFSTPAELASHPACRTDLLQASKSVFLIFRIEALSSLKCFRIKHFGNFTRLNT